MRPGENAHTISGSRIGACFEVQSRIADHGDSPNILNVCFFHAPKDHEGRWTARRYVIATDDRINESDWPSGGRSQNVHQRAIEPGIQRDADFSSLEPLERLDRLRNGQARGAPPPCLERGAESIVELGDKR